MADPALLEAVKLALRITSAAYDEEIEDLIAAARADLLLCGVAPDMADAQSLDPLIKRAVIVYCKAEFGLDNPEAERYRRSYEALRTHLALSAEYGEEHVS